MLTRLIALITLSLMSFLFSGCFDSNPDEQSVPWSRPAEWERGAPGFGSGL
jgi:hypothetical protein